MDRTGLTLGSLNEGDVFYFFNDKKRRVYRCGKFNRVQQHGYYHSWFRHFDFNYPDVGWKESRLSPKRATNKVIRLESVEKPVPQELEIL